jgi:phosphoribosylformylglycinamidine synthase
VRRIGSTAGTALTLPGERPIPLKPLRDRFEGWLPAYMAGAAGGRGAISYQRH